MNGDNEIDFEEWIHLMRHFFSVLPIFPNNKNRDKILDLVLFNHFTLL